jgi:hypothetical protein
MTQPQSSTPRPKPRPPTPAAINAQQKADAEKDRQRHQAVVPQPAAVPAVPDKRTPQQAYLDDIAPASLVGRQCPMKSPS